jgi:PAS domain S-box-containing protein
VSDSGALSERALVLAPRGRDAAIACAVLEEAGVPAAACTDIGCLLDELTRGAGVAVVTEETLTNADLHGLAEWIHDQPAWSDFPFVLLTQRGGGVERNPSVARLSSTLGNVTFLERPFHPTTLLSVVQTALRGRRRQYAARRSEEAMRESEQRFRLISDSAPVPMWVTDAYGRRSFVNQAYLEFLGVSFDEAVAFDWRKVLHPDDMPRILAEQMSGESSLKPFSLEARYRRADGEWRWLRSQSRPRFTDTGGHDGFVGLAYDITDSKRAQADLEHINELLEERVSAALTQKGEAEAALRQAQRLEAVGQLTSGVAHDFNNLLTVVLGNIRLMERNATDATMQRRLGMMHQAAERGAKLTAQLLAFSRRQKLEPRPVDLNETVGAMRDLLQSTMGGSVKLHTELEHGLWPALIDPTQIELVILNLAINARDAMEVGGSLTVSTANVKLGAPSRPEEPPAGEYVMVAVTDTGSGMPEEVLAKAFEPFFTTKDVGKGSGLGLSQVFGLAKQSGGGVSIETEVGKGTSVKVYLPRTRIDAEEEEAPSPGAAPRARRGSMVLVVDDDPAVREITSSMLSELGYAVVEASSGAAALHVLELGGEPDLVLMDFAMPGMNGVEAARLARARRPNLPILFVTGYADSTILSEAADEEIVQKPFGEAELAAKVSRLLRRRRKAEQAAETSGAHVS